MAKKRARATAPRKSLDLGAHAVAAAAFVAFLPALLNGFVWDDLDYVKNNPILHAKLGAAIAGIAGNVVVGNYHPLTMASLALDNALLGPGPFVFHLTNVILHAVNAVLVGRLLLAFGFRRDAAWLAALLWAVHPLRVESVAWISGRKDVLSTCLVLAACLAYVRHVREEAGPRRAYGLALLSFGGALLAKAAAVVLVPLTFLFDWFLGRRFSKAVVAEKSPFLLLALLFGVVALKAQASAGAIPLGQAHSLAARLAVACYGLVFYPLKTVVPWGLSALYPYPAGPSRLPAGSVAAVAVVVLAAGALAWWGRRARSAVFAAGFYVATVALVLQLLPVGGAVAADRYSYLPAVGFSIAIAAMISSVPFRRSLAASVVAVALLLTGATWVRCAIWRDAPSLWNDVLEKYPDAALAHQNRGVALANNGEHRAAVLDYNAAISLNPLYADAWANRGGSRADLGELDAALSDLREAVRLDPERATYRFNLGLVLGDKGRWDEALASLSEAIRLKPDFAAAYLNRGLALEQMGRSPEGALDVKRAKDLGYPVSPAVLKRFE